MPPKRILLKKSLATLFFATALTLDGMSQKEFYLGSAVRTDKANYLDGDYVQSNHTNFILGIKQKISEKNFFRAELAFFSKSIILNSEGTEAYGNEIGYSISRTFSHANLSYSYLSHRLALGKKLLNVSNFNLSGEIFLQGDFLLLESEKNHSQYRTYYANVFGVDEPYEINEEYPISFEAFDAVTSKKIYPTLGMRFSPCFIRNKLCFSAFGGAGLSFGQRVFDNNGDSYSLYTSANRGTPSSSIPDGAQYRFFYEFGLLLALSKS